MLQLKLPAKGDGSSPPIPLSPDSTEAAQFRKHAIAAGLIDTLISLGYAATSQTDFILDRFITNDPTMLEMKRCVKILSRTEYNVLVIGETGTGKEIIAQALHGNRKGPFVGINCTSLPDYLLESELFGHVKGAFTGADRDRIGLLVLANNGTLMLDEVARMPPHLQAKLLRAIQEKKVRPVGSNYEVDIKCRIVATSQFDLKKRSMEDNGILGPRFLLDLYWRLAILEVHVTPLRERRDDIHEILDSNNFDPPPSVIPNHVREVIAALPLYGNVRELEALVARYKLLGEQGLNI